MNMKKILVSFSAIVSLLLLVMTVSATSLTVDDKIHTVEVNGVDVKYHNPSITAGETIIVFVISAPG